MGLLNSSAGYGSLTKLLHWLMVAAFAFQYVAGHVMGQIGPNGELAGWSQNDAYNWHKSIGLVALALALARIFNRRLGSLPPWAPTLSETEQRFVHRAEQILYLSMVVMPVSGFFYVMAGGYGVHLFGRWHLPNPFGDWPALASASQWLHIASGWLLLATVAAHIGLMLRHQLILKDGLLRRMLPSLGEKRRKR